MKRLLFSLFLAAILAACAPSASGPGAPGSPVNPLVPPRDAIQPTAPPDEYAPQPGDENLLRGNVYLDSARLLILESYPPQATLTLAGNLPDPCHRLRVRVAAPEAENRILVEVYSLADPTAVCVQVLHPFQASVPLSLEGLASGHYTVWVNGEKIGEFDL